MALSEADLDQIRQIVREEQIREKRRELLTVQEIMATEKIKSRSTVLARAKRRGIPERTIGCGLRTSKSEPLRFSRAEWEAGKEQSTRRVKALARA